jgi:hypothetical protein
MVVNEHEETRMQKMEVDGHGYALARHMSYARGYVSYIQETKKASVRKAQSTESLNDALYVIEIIDDPIWSTTH